MSEELVLEGVAYITSKRAAETTEYAQDYIGQLCRKKLIDARRIGGLWYVNPDSLNSYTSAPRSSRTKVQATVIEEDPDSMVGFDGINYISANRASDLSGYNQDYVGQLARSGKVLSRQIGNRWYVDAESLMKHKEEKDQMLASVQADSVGLAYDLDKRSSPTLGEVENEESLSYEKDDAPLLPETNKDVIEAEGAPESSFTNFFTRSEVAAGGSEKEEFVQALQSLDEVEAEAEPDQEEKFAGYIIPKDEGAYSPVTFWGVRAGVVFLTALLPFIVTLALRPSVTETGNSQTAATGSIIDSLGTSIENMLIPIKKLK